MSRFSTPKFITPLGSPIRRALHLTKLNPQDAWLPITESINGNAYYETFHTLSSGIGIQAFILPVSFLGQTWGIICLTIAFIWQLYTLYLLMQFHESTETGIRYSSYMQLSSAALKVVTLTEQIQQFITVLNNLTAAMGLEATETMFSKSVFSISIGSNDIFSYFLTNSIPKQSFIAILMSQYEAPIKALYSVGARKIGIISVPPIGCCPSFSLCVRHTDVETQL
ncbi:lysine histidine transporter-like 4 [Actinidia eriantha]|uniref:lysine histidine transporter-like 4 n=1 Tax=Actinidia eriantha TaxID=165200 RepID=UPI00258874FC|nr:lysine histidine transporter-like 4 [Actinidia eriantha]